MSTLKTLSRGTGQILVPRAPADADVGAVLANPVAQVIREWLGIGFAPRKKMVVETVVAALEATLLNNLGTDGFTLKLGSFGKFSVRHKPGILRRIPFTGKTILTKDRRKIRFTSLGNLRRQERVD